MAKQVSRRISRYEYFFLVTGTTWYGTHSITLYNPTAQQLVYIDTSLFPKVHTSARPAPEHSTQTSTTKCGKYISQTHQGRVLSK